MYWYDSLFLVWSFVFGMLFLIDFFFNEGGYHIQNIVKY